MEDKGGFFSRIFKRKKEAPATNVTPPSQEQPVQATAPLSAAEERKKILEKRGQKQAQGGYENIVKDAQAGIVHNSSGTSPVKIKKESERVALTQTMNQATDVQKRVTPKGTASERFNKLTKSPPKPDVSPPPLRAETPLTQTNTPNSMQDNTKPTLSEKKIQEINPETLDKSLKTPPSEWGKETKPVVSKKPINKNESVAPFPAGTFPGVDKWQPGKGAIKGEVLEKVIKEVKEMPKYPSNEPAPKAEKNIPTPIQQEKVKEPA